jgi:COP9 signalosome complex subunit 4
MFLKQLYKYRYKALLDQIMIIENQEERFDETKSFIDLLINENVGLVISRQLFTDLCSMLTRLTVEESKLVANYALEKIQPRAISFEDQVTSYRQFMSEIYEREGDWRKAANTLNGIPLETSQK